jgi:hypothetical protein
MKREINDKARDLGLKYFPNEQNIWARENIEAIYCSGACIAMAEWMQKKMIEKAVEWLNNNWREYVYQDGDGIVHFGHWESDFRKAMEE